MKRREDLTTRVMGFVGGLLALAVMALAWGGALAMNAAQKESSGANAKPGGGQRMIRMVDDKGWRVLETVTYENMSIFAIVTARGGVDTSAFLTLDEGLVSGDVLVTERGSDVLRRSRGRDGGSVMPRGGDSATVNQLVLVNRSAKPLLLLAGEVVTGGKQDRVIAKDRIVAPGGEPLPLDVFCVERGRWSGSAGAGFTASNLMAHPSVREKAAVDQRQDQVWGAVRAGSTSAAARRANSEASAGGGVAAAAPAISERVLSETVAAEAQSESYAKLRKSPRVGDGVESFAGEVERRFAKAVAGVRKDEMVVGVVVAYGGEMAWADAFASGRLFTAYWPKLLRSYVVEALARPKSAEKATVADAREFLQPLGGRETIENEPGVYRWKQVSEGRYAVIEIEAAKPVAVVLHWVKIQRTT